MTGYERSIFKKMFSLNITSFYRILLNIGFKGLENQCIVFLFTFYTVPQLFWNQGFICGN